MKKPPTSNNAIIMTKYIFLHVFVIITKTVDKSNKSHLTSFAKRI